MVEIHNSMEEAQKKANPQAEQDAAVNQFSGQNKK